MIGSKLAPASKAATLPACESSIISDSDGFMEIVCNGSSLASTINAGKWFLQLHREEQFIIHDNASKRIKEEWRDGVPLNLTIIGNSTIQLDIPEDLTGASGQTAIVTG